MSSRLNRLVWLASTALTLSFATAAHAQDAELKGDAAAGQKKFYTCYGCHGIENYRNAYPDYAVPKLKHQNQAYLVAALKEYRTGDRPHPTMHAQAISLSDQDIADIATYLQGDTVSKPETASPKGKVPAQIETCKACHGETGLGLPVELTPKPPVLAGQHVDYLEQALTSYRNGRRKNAVMDAMAQALKSDEDIDVVAAYFAAQTSPLVTAKTNSK
jgi:cytochrome c553